MLRAIARPLAALSILSVVCAAQAGTSGGVTAIISKLPAEQGASLSAFLKFESESALKAFLKAHAGVERLHPKLLWALGDRATLEKAAVREAVGVVASSFSPNHSFRLPDDGARIDGTSGDFADAIESLGASPERLNITNVDTRLWGITRVGAPSAWNVTRGENVLVAVVDTGVDRDHPALSGNAEVNAKEAGGKPGVDDDRNGYVDDEFGWNFFGDEASPDDDQGHGSHVSGTVAGNLAGKDFYGVAPAARVLAVKTHNSSGASREDAVVKGILYAADRGAKVINCSWGGAPEAPDYSQVLFDAIKYAGEKGALLVAAAGNDGDDNDRVKSYPSNYDLPNVIAVAATTSRDGLAFFSNYGKKSVDIGAPGASIYSVRSGGGYINQSGTSMAAPHIAGAAALVFSKLGASANPASVKKWLMDNSKTMDALSGKTVAGSLDVSALAK